MHPAKGGKEGTLLKRRNKERTSLSKKALEL
jgi:hypothetical protein